MKKILFGFFTLFSLTAFSQEVLLSRDVAADTVRPTVGPNLKNFTHQYLSYGSPFFTNEDVNFIKPGASIVIDYGYRYKRRLNNTFALGLDFSFNWAAFKVKQGDGKTVPDTIINEKEKYKVNSMTPAMYLRINVGRRGNYVGKYLDLGAYGSWNWKKAHVTSNRNSQDEWVKISISNLDYMESFSYGVLARIGYNRYALTARYRLSNLFTEKSGLPELPRLTAGLEFGIFK